VTANNAGRGPRIKGKGRRHFGSNCAAILGRSGASIGSRDRPHFPFTAALATRGPGMSIGALIKGGAVLPTKVSLQIRPA